MRENTVKLSPVKRLPYTKLGTSQCWIEKCFEANNYESGNRF